jgi:hypothetical protein
VRVAVSWKLELTGSIGLVQHCIEDHIIMIKRLTVASMPQRRRGYGSVLSRISRKLMISVLRGIQASLNFISSGPFKPRRERMMVAGQRDVERCIHKTSHIERTVKQLRALTWGCRYRHREL